MEWLAGVGSDCASGHAEDESERGGEAEMALPGAPRVPCAGPPADRAAWTELERP